MVKLKISEAAVKKAVTEYLTYQQNMGKLLFTRLQCGSRLIPYGDHVQKIQMCEPGWADFVVFQGYEKGHYFVKGDAVLVSGCLVTFLEIKSSTGKQSPDQVKFAQQAMKQNCRYFLVRDAGELEGILT